MRLAARAALIFVLLMTQPVMALNLRSLDCKVDAFTDESRYPPEEEFIRRAEMVTGTLVYLRDRSPLVL